MHMPLAAINPIPLPHFRLSKILQRKRKKKKRKENKIAFGAAATNPTRDTVILLLNYCWLLCAASVGAWRREGTVDHWRRIIRWNRRRRVTRSNNKIMFRSTPFCCRRMEMKGTAVRKNFLSLLLLSIRSYVRYSYQRTSEWTMSVNVDIELQIQTVYLFHFVHERLRRFSIDQQKRRSKITETPDQKMVNRNTGANDCCIFCSGVSVIWLLCFFLRQKPGRQPYMHLNLCVAHVYWILITRA